MRKEEEKYVVLMDKGDTREKIVTANEIRGAPRQARSLLVKPMKRVTSKNRSMSSRSMTSSVGLGSGKKSGPPGTPVRRARGLGGIWKPPPSARRRGPTRAFRAPRGGRGSGRGPSPRLSLACGRAGAPVFLRRGLGAPPATAGQAHIQAKMRASGAVYDRRGVPPTEVPCGKFSRQV